AASSPSTDMRSPAPSPGEGRAPRSSAIRCSISRHSRSRNRVQVSIDPLSMTRCPPSLEARAYASRILRQSSQPLGSRPCATGAVRVCFASMTLLTLRRAELSYGHHPLLDDAQLNVEANERIGLIGRNGTGKSSLLNVIAGRAALDDGEDRKSTRLNSSHVKSSYAVFCLKKKRVYGPRPY